MVDLLLLGEGGGRVSLLQQGVACITLILQDVIHSLIFPYPSRCVLCVQDFRDFPRIPAGEVFVEDTPHDLSLLLVDSKAFPVQPEAPGGAAGVELAAFHPALIAPAHIAGDGFALLLGEGGVDGGDELAAHIGGVDALALEADVDAQLLQLPHRLQTVLCVPGEAGDGFDEDLVNEPSAAVRHHTLEILPLCGGGAGDALVGVDIHHAPLGLAGDQLGVVAVLRREGVELVIGVRADAGIGRYPQLRIPRLLRRLDLDDAGLRCQRRCAVCQMLFRHACSPPVFATQTLPQPCSESY